MRSTKLLLLLFANAVFSAAVSQQYGFGSENGFDKRQFGKSAGGKVADPAGSAPRRQVLQSPSKIPGVQRVKIRSGPYNVPNMGKKSIPGGHAGMLENYGDTSIEKPCQECTLLYQTAGLEYANGTNANIDSGMWLHHMVHFNAGPSRWDPAGYGKTCIPFLPVGTTPTRAERIFTAGNERTPYDYNPKGTGLSSGTGYHLKKEDRFKFLVELMNMNMQDQIVYLTMVYDFLDGPLPPGWNEIKPFWLDANMCSTSEVKPLKESGAFTIESKPWNPNFEGKIMYAQGHLHDGGVEIDIRASSSSSLCKSTPKYSETSEYRYRGVSMGGDKVAADHISSMEGCKNGDITVVKELKKGQSWIVRGSYDYKAHEGNLERGKQAEIMAIGVVLVSVPAGGVRPM